MLSLEVEPHPSVLRIVWRRIRKRDAWLVVIHGAGHLFVPVLAHTMRGPECVLLRLRSEVGDLIYSVSSDPPIIVFSSSGAKDTLSNIRATSEFDWAGLTPATSAVVGASRVGESPAALECRLRDIQEFGHGPSYLIIGDVVHIAVDPALLVNGILDNTRTQPVGRLARTQYTHSRAFFDLEHPTYRGLLEAGVRPKRDGR